MLPNLVYIEKLYRAFLDDPNSVDISWQAFFQGMELGQGFEKAGGSSEGRILLLIHAYRVFGHLKARFNPFVGDLDPEELQIERLGFSSDELEKAFPTCGVLEAKEAPLKEIIERLEQIYCGTVGIEYMDRQDPNLEKFIQTEVEGQPKALTPEEQKRVLHELMRAEMFETFLHMKYTGQKRFSLEGGETLIPLLFEMLYAGADLEVEEAVIGMAHRGRLNVLANIMGKDYSSIYAEFDPNYVPQEGDGSGDVKYHKGFDATLKTLSGKEMKLRIPANPSHLEAVDPVVEGVVHGKQQGRDPKTVLPILIHGDASVAGQGVVYETLQLSKVEGYKTGGTIHIVVNNQIGFTALPEESRSTRYCTDIAKGFGAPVFHVNAEDPQGCVLACRLAMAIRQKFGCDVFIDLNCYRKYGHNEGDEPSYTQPLLYENIRSRKGILSLYRDDLVQKGVLKEAEWSGMEQEFKANLDAALKEVESLKIGQEFKCPVPQDTPCAETGVNKNLLLELGKKVCAVPENINIYPKLKRIYDDRLKMLEGGPLDWGMAETLAYASLLHEGFEVRISGQDSQRGTFSHRHSAITDSKTSTRYFPLQHISDASFHAYNSPLSEYAVLLFDYGYALARPKGLTIWEAQFGDFANGAQIAIDQFIATSEQKWREVVPLTLMLPHGYEGQGPEHSSARIERFLQLAANDSMTICNNSTPAQLFHLLRHYTKEPERRPLVIFMPKALLRYEPSLCTFDDLTQGAYQKVIDDKETQNVRRLLFCTGKVYYDLIEARKDPSIAIIRIEQLYPFPQSEIKALLAKYKDVKEIYWVQEEHQNMGAWTHIHFAFDGLTNIGYVGRPKSASPAAGFVTLHKRELETLIKRALS